MQGTYLRTNYRRTGAQLDITAIGNYMLSTCMFGDSVGHNVANGGFMYFSCSGSIQGNEVTAGMIDGGSLAGVSRAWIDSTYGLMSRYYGGAQFNSGYRFMPIGFRFISFSGVGYAGSTPNMCLPVPHLFHVTFISGSCIMASILLQLPESAMSVSLRGTAEFKAFVWGFIISSP